METYIRTFYNDFINIDKDFIYQESLRKKDALTGPSLDGLDSLQEIKKTFLVANISDEFRTFIKTHLSQVKEDSINVREQVKKIWTYPLSGYLKWNYLESKEILKDVNSVILDVKPKLQIIDGKIYCTLPKINDNISKLTLPIAQKLGVEGLVPNFESEHITIVNSNVLAKIYYSNNKNKIDLLLEKYNDCTNKDIVINEFKHTISLDWSPFSVCVVVGIKSNWLTEFCTNFVEILDNKTLYKIPSLHLTTLVLPRKN